MQNSPTLPPHRGGAVPRSTAVLGGAQTAGAILRLRSGAADATRHVEMQNLASERARSPSSVPQWLQVRGVNTGTVSASRQGPWHRRRVRP
jgi:hypothetical protein